MKLGMNMLLWSTDVTGPEYLPVFEMLGDAGYDGIEVPIFGAADLGALRRLGEHLDGLGLVPLGVTACAQDDSPISTDPAWSSPVAASRRSRHASSCART